MNNHLDAKVLADRLRFALEESSILRARLRTTLNKTHTLVDTFNEELRTIVPIGAASGLRDAKKKPAAVPFPRPIAAVL